MSSQVALPHVLLVEPDAEQATAIQAVLQAKALSVDWAVSAQAAIFAADAKRPDIVILELALPHHNGVEFLHEFRSYPEWAPIPVIVFSQQKIDEPHLLAGLKNIAYIYKPTSSIKALHEAMQGMLQ